jgi:hypothetical protein
MYLSLSPLLLFFQAVDRREKSTMEIAKKGRDEEGSSGFFLMGKGYKKKKEWKSEKSKDLQSVGGFF